jgi:uncharacterized membrane protein
MSWIGYMSSSRRARSIALAVLGLLGLAYPFVVYVGLQAFPPIVLALVLVAVLAVRLLIARDRSLFALAGAAIVAAILGMTALSPIDAVRFYPVVVSLTLAVIFGGSLLNPPSVIERLARLREPRLPEGAIAYTRKVTQLWFAFFLINAAIAAWTAQQETLELWTLYNGLLSYILVGVLFVGEMLVRRRMRSTE